MQHCVTCNTVLHATLCYMQHCVRCSTVLHATLCYMQNCVTCNTVLHATLCFMQHCVTCKTVIHATLCYMQNCVCILIDSARHIENSFDQRLSCTFTSLCRISRCQHQPWIIRIERGSRSWKKITTFTTMSTTTM